MGPIVRALETTGPHQPDELARLVGAALCDPDRLDRALALAVADGLAYRTSDGALAGSGRAGCGPAVACRAPYAGSMEGLVILLLMAAVVVVVVVSRRSSKARELERQRAELEPVKKLAFEDITALGEELQALDLDLAGHQLGVGEHADYQRALDAYESAKAAGDAMTRPDDVRHVTQILDDGRYAIACVRARVVGAPLPTRRPPCFFDPRHGLSVTDVPWTPPGGATRDVPACALDAERVAAGADPDARMVMVGAQRVPYWQGGRAYQPYATGYFGAFTPMNWMFAGMLFGGFGGIGEGIGDGIAGLGEGIGDGIGSIGDGIGDMFDGFDF